MLEIDLFTAHSYKVEELAELPGSGGFNIPLLYIPQPKNRPEHNGLWLKLTPATGKSWIGVFAFVFESPRSFSRVVSTLDADRVCVISRSAGYIVKVNEPGIWERVAVPVLDVRLLPEHQLLVLSGYTELVAYGKNGLAWCSPQLCWDELKIVNVTHNTIEGTGYDPTNSLNRESRFAVDIGTGRSLLPCPTTNTDGTPAW
jgi:hypothetical protein